MFRPRRKIIRRRIIRRRIIRRRATGIPSRLKRYVKKELHRNIENKERINYAANQTIITSDVNTCTYPLLIATGQAVTNDARIGNQIKVVKGIWRATFNLKPYNATTNPSLPPVWVKMWVVKDLKNMGQSATMDTTNYGKFFKGNNTSLGFQSNTLDINLSVNPDLFRVLYSKTFKLGMSSVYGSSSNGSWSDNSPFAKQIVFNYGKWARKQLKFDDSTTYPTNDNLYVVIQPVYADGTSSAAKELIEFHYVNTMTFEDA